MGSHATSAGSFAPASAGLPRHALRRRRLTTAAMVLTLLAGLPGGIVAPSPVAAAITAGTTADQLAAAIVGTGVTLLGTNVLTQTGTAPETPNAVGTSNATIAGFTANGGSFAVLTTGSAANVAMAARASGNCMMRPI